MKVKCIRCGKEFRMGMCNTGDWKKRLADIYTKKTKEQMYRAGGMDFHQMIRKP